MVNALYSQQRSFTKHKFDPTLKSDLAIYKAYIGTGTWGSATCPFELEWPHLTIPGMIATKIAEHTVSKL
jgi:hypothetical protein